MKRECLKADAKARLSLPARLRDAAEYHLGNDLIGRMQQAACWQQQQRAALIDAAEEIERLTRELAK